MPLNIRNDTVNQLAEKLAVRKHMSKTDAVRTLENELRRLDEAMPLRMRLRPLQDWVLSRPATGVEVGKAFYPGSARPEPRLMAISNRLSACNPRWGRARTHNSGKAAQGFLLWPLPLPISGPRPG